MWVNFVNAVEPRMASFRYRCVWPGLALAEAGQRYLISDDAEQVPLNSGTSGIIFTKTFNQKALELAWRAKAHDVPVLLDVCDNIFVPDYLGGIPGLMTVACFRTMATFADCILVPTAALKIRVAEELGQSAPPIEVIPDGTEDPDEVRELINRLEDKHSRLSADGYLELTDSVMVTSAYAGTNRAGYSILPEPLAQLAKRSEQMLRSMLRNDRSANYAAINTRLIRLKDHLPNSEEPRDDSSKPSKPDYLRQDAAETNSDKSNRVACKTVLWFGNAGHSHGNYGIATILRFLPALKKINQQQPIELVVVSNNEPKYNDYIQRLPITSRYVEWNPIDLFSHLRAADVVILPNSNDEFSKTKSANRILLALSQGVPVVTEEFADLALLRDCVSWQDPYAGLQRYLIDDNGARDLRRAEQVIAAHFSRRAIGQKLTEVLDNVSARDPRQRPCLLFAFDLLQDIEILKPVLEYFSGRDDWRVRVLASNWLMSQPSSFASYLSTKNIVPIVQERDDILSGSCSPVLGSRLVFLASETNLGPHRVAHSLARQAEKLGIKSVTFQHGLENEGLTYFGDNKSVHFASQQIVTWNDQTSNNGKLRADTRDKCLPLGIFRSSVADAPTQDLHGFLKYQRIVGVFENLHWERYSDLYRMDFILNLIALAQENTDSCFLLKPHPAGRWFELSNNINCDMPDNIVAVDQSDEFWQSLSATQIVSLVDAVITTPSTIAVDAALARVPVAVVAHTLGNLDMYKQLDLLRNRSDWLNFVDACLVDQVSILQRVEQFLSASVDKVNPMQELEEQVSQWVAV